MIWLGFKILFDSLFLATNDFYMIIFNWFNYSTVDGLVVLRQSRYILVERLLAFIGSPEMPFQSTTYGSLNMLYLQVSDPKQKNPI